MINFAICDDEMSMVDELCRVLSQYMDDRQFTSYSITRFLDGQSLLESGGDFDLIFLDIQMKHPDGMETARKLRLQKNHRLLVFVTVLKEYVFDAFEVEAFDYLIKPLDNVRFRRTMDRVLGVLAQRTNKTIVIQKENSCEVILLSQILYIEVFNRKIYLHQTDGKITDYYGRLKDLEQRVDGRFFKCHRSYLVNLDYIRGCSAGQVFLLQGKAIPVSRLRERDLTQALLRHMKEKG